MFSLSASLASADPLELSLALRQAESFERLHLDIDDGNFIDDISFGMNVVRAVSTRTAVPLDAHLEVLNPMVYAEPLLDAGVKSVCAHVEALAEPRRFIDLVRGHGGKAGLALNFNTPLSALAPYMDALDYAIILSSRPEDEGAPFRPEALDKLRAAKSLLPPGAELWADGGIGPQEMISVIHAGVDTAVVGRAVFMTSDPAQAYADMLSIGRSI